MSTANALISSVKRLLKARGLKYRDLAKELNLSESAIKQMFSTNNMSLSRLEQICRVLKIGFAELLEDSAQADAIDEMTLENERQLAGNTKLLLVAFCLSNGWTAAAICSHYRIDSLEMTQLLAQLDRIKMIELLPDNQVRLLISQNFQWQPGGPIEMFFKKEVQNRFFNSSFTGDGELRLVANGSLPLASVERLMEQMQQLRGRFEDETRQARSLPVDRKEGTTMVVAIRQWQFAAFQALERDQKVSPIQATP